MKTGISGLWSGRYSPEAGLPNLEDRGQPLRVPIEGDFVSKHSRSTDASEENEAEEEQREPEH